MYLDREEENFQGCFNLKFHNFLVSGAFSPTLLSNICSPITSELSQGVIKALGLMVMKIIKVVHVISTQCAVSISVWLVMKVIASAEHCSVFIGAGSMHCTVGGRKRLQHQPNAGLWEYHMSRVSVQIKISSESSPVGLEIIMIMITILHRQ